MKWIRRKEEGQSLVEFALVLPILMILVLGIIDFGQIFFNYLVIQNTSRDAARYGSVLATNEQITQAIHEKTSFLDHSNMTITITPDPSLRKHGTQIKVLINYKVNLYTPMWNNILPNPYPIKAETVMRIE